MTSIHTLDMIRPVSEFTPTFEIRLKPLNTEFLHTLLIKLAATSRIVSVRQRYRNALEIPSRDLVTYVAKYLYRNFPILIYQDLQGRYWYAEVQN